MRTPPSMGSFIGRAREKVVDRGAVQTTVRPPPAGWCSTRTGARSSWSYAAFPEERLGRTSDA